MNTLNADLKLQSSNFIHTMQLKIDRECCTQ